MSKRTTRSSKSDLDPASRAGSAEALARQLTTSARVSSPYRTAVMSEVSGSQQQVRPPAQQQPRPPVPQQQQPLNAMPAAYTPAFGEAVRTGLIHVNAQQTKTASDFAGLSGRVDNLASQVTTEATAAAEHRKTTDDSLSDIEAHLAALPEIHRAIIDLQASDGSRAAPVGPTDKAGVGALLATDDLISSSIWPLMTSFHPPSSALEVPGFAQWPSTGRRGCSDTLRARSFGFSTYLQAVVCAVLFCPTGVTPLLAPVVLCLFSFWIWCFAWIFAFCYWIWCLTTYFFTLCFFAILFFAFCSCFWCIASSSSSCSFCFWIPAAP